MNRLWLVFKALLSAVLLAPAGYALWAMCGPKPFQPDLLLMSSLLLFFVALLWINWERPEPVLPWVGVFLGVLLAGLSVQKQMGDTLYPQVCEGRRALLCEIENLLYSLGGPPLAATPYVVLAAWLLWVSLRALWRRLTATRF